MKNKKLNTLFSNTNLNGIYCVDLPVNINNFIQSADDLQLITFRINGLNINNKETFLSIFSEEMKFPSYFGKNWDAFEECIRDLEWITARGYLIIYKNYRQFLDNEPDEFAKALLSFKTAVAFWRDQGMPMYILLIDDKSETTINFKIDNLPI